MRHETMPSVERCLRCAAPMEWRHQTWQCVRCRFKLGCCEGQAPEARAPEACAPDYESSRR